MTPPEASTGGMHPARPSAQEPVCARSPPCATLSVLHSLPLAVPPPSSWPMLTSREHAARKRQQRRGRHEVGRVSGILKACSSHQQLISTSEHFLKCVVCTRQGVSRSPYACANFACSCREVANSAPADREVCMTTASTASWSCNYYQYPTYTFAPLMADSALHTGRQTDQERSHHCRESLHTLRYTHAAKEH